MKLSKCFVTIGRRKAPHCMLAGAKQGRGRLVRGLITAGADIQTRDERGETGLDLGVRGGHREVAEMFHDHGISGYNR